ncbi:MAG TPA: zinc ribbon domain-containing protein [Terriglobales bacterium]|nr:zinc ribbon domain-containing protein [Terriglobales bacterium]
MPLYEYKCRKCGHRFERIVKFSDPPLRKCPECGGKVEQLLSRSAVHFKGSGWYVSDYARKGKTDSGSGEGAEPAGKPEEKAEKTDKAETKPKPKSEPKKSSGKK